MRQPEDEACLPASRAWSGMRVLDLSAGIAGPHVGLLLRRQGARVIKIEPPEGDWARRLGTHDADHSAYSVYFNQGKESLCVDLKQAEGRKIVHRLAREADVVIEAFRPGVARRLGVGYEELSVGRPDLLYLSISGYGPSGPLAANPGTDSVMQAFSGLMHLNRDAGGNPQRFPYVLIDVAAGVYGYNLLASAYILRLRHGRGRHLELSLMESSLALQAAAIVRHQYERAGEREEVVPVGVFAAADGFVSISVSRPDQFERFCQALQQPAWIADPRFCTNAARTRNKVRFLELVRGVFAQATVTRWLEVFRRADLLIAPVRTYDDLLADGGEVNPALAAYAAPGFEAPLRFPQPPAGAPDPDGGAEASPRCGEHSVPLLRETGFTQESIEAWMRQGVVAGPGSIPNPEETHK